MLSYCSVSTLSFWVLFFWCLLISICAWVYHFSTLIFRSFFFFFFPLYEVLYILVTGVVVLHVLHWGALELWANQDKFLSYSPNMVAVIQLSCTDLNLDWYEMQAWSFSLPLVLMSPINSPYRERLVTEHHPVLGQLSPNIHHVQVQGSRSPDFPAGCPTASNLHLSRLTSIPWKTWIGHFSCPSLEKACGYDAVVSCHFLLPFFLVSVTSSFLKIQLKINFHLTLIKLGQFPGY